MARLFLSSWISFLGQPRPRQQHGPAQAEGLWCFSCKANTGIPMEGAEGQSRLRPLGLPLAWLGCPGQRLQQEELWPPLPAALPGAQAGSDSCPGAQPPLYREALAKGLPKRRSTFRVRPVLPA